MPLLLPIRRTPLDFFSNCRLPEQLQRELPNMVTWERKKSKSSVNILSICNYKRNIERFHVAGMGIQHTTGRWKSSATGTQDET